MSRDKKLFTDDVIFILFKHQMEVSNNIDAYFSSIEGMKST